MRFTRDQEAMQRYETRLALIAHGYWDEFLRLRNARKQAGQVSKTAWDFALQDVILRHIGPMGRREEFERYVEMIQKLVPGRRSVWARADASRCLLRLTKGASAEVPDLAMRKFQEGFREKMKKKLTEAGKIDRWKPTVDEYVASGLGYFDACVKAFHVLMDHEKSKRVYWE